MGAGMGAMQPTVHLPRRQRTHVLVVCDGTGAGHALVYTLRTQGYAADRAVSEADALAHLRTTPFHVVLCELRVPELTALTFIREALAIQPDLAVVAMSGAVSARPETEAVEAGAAACVRLPVVMEELVAALEEALDYRQRRIERRQSQQLVQEAVTHRTQALAERTELLEREQAALREATVRVTEALITAMEAKDLYLRGHSHRVGALGAAIAEELGLEADVVETIRLAGRLHDVGKIGIRESVLNKPGPLTPEEYAHVQEHVQIGVDILAPFTHLGDVLTFVHHHHEHWDGSGYPQRLQGDDITLGGRILCAADAYDALTSSRAHRGAMSDEAALAILEAASGRLLDPRIFATLERVVRQQQSLVFLDPANQGVSPRPTVNRAQSA